MQYPSTTASVSTSRQCSCFPSFIHRAQEQEDHQSREWRSPPICELAATFHRLIRHQALCQRCNTRSLFLKREEGVKAELHTQTAATGSCFNTSHPSWPAPAKVHQLGQQVIKALVCAFLYTKVLQKKKKKPIGK